MEKRSIVLAGAILAILVAMIYPSLIPKESPGNITLGDIGSTTFITLVWSYGHEKGIFQDYGLIVNRATSRDPYTDVVNLLSGQIDITCPSPSLIANMHNEGEDIRIVMALAEAEDFALIARPGVTGLEGKRVGVIGRTSDSYNILKWHLEEQGTDIETACDIVEIQNPSNLATALLTDKIDAAALWGGYTGRVLENGGTILKSYNVILKETIGHSLYHNILIVREEMLAEPSTLSNFLRAVREIVAEINEDPEEAAEIWAEFSGEPLSRVRGWIDRAKLVGDLNDEIREDISAFFAKAADEGYIERSPSEDIFYADWLER
jgi:ABC-type nitrate/sulfonate/bicarbonate transport system substrate-binding protein